MDYQVSARKYRPSTFQDVVGQGHVVQTLVNAITSNRIAQAFLFSGTRGVGKTTVARILAKALDCERGPTSTPCNACPNCMDIAAGTSVDVIEIDGASNTSVDDIREVRENIKFAPFRGTYRVYIIDEVHMLSTSAFNALLKTLEEPPPHVVFVFATTELHKIPATILSRCQHYNFRRITRSELVARLRYVAQEEGIEIEDRSLLSLARASEGSMRDALSLLDQAVAFGGESVRHADLEVLLGSVPQEQVQAMISAVVAQDSPQAVRVIAALLDQGHDLRAYCSDLVECVRNLLVAAVVPSPEDLRGLMDVPDDERPKILECAKAFTVEQLHELFRIFSQAEDHLRASAHPRFVLEVAAVRATRLLLASSSGGVGSVGVATEAGAILPERAHPREASVSGPPAGGPSSSEGGVAAVEVAAAPSGSPPSQPAPSGTSGTPSPSGGVGGSATLTPRTGVAASPGTVRERPQRANETGSRSKSSAVPLDLDWELVQERVAAAYPSIGPFLERGVFVKGEGDQLTIGYVKAETVARAFLEKEDNLRAVQGVCSDMAGRAVRVRIIEMTDSTQAGPSRAQARATQTREQKLALLDQARSHPLVKHALDMFGGEIVEVRQRSSREEVRE